MCSAGRLVRSMIDEMNMKENGSCPEEKIHFYSAVSPFVCYVCARVCVLY